MFISVGSKDQRDHIPTPGVGLELTCNGGLCRGISLKRDECHLHLKRFSTLASVASWFQSNPENSDIAAVDLDPVCLSVYFLVVSFMVR